MHPIARIGFIICVAFDMTTTSLANATECKCRQHKSEAEAGGTCSRTEDAQYCTLRFSSTTEAEYKAFTDALAKIGMEVMPREALQFAFERPSKEWDQTALQKMLPPLFAVSQRTLFREQTAIVATALRDALKQGSPTASRISEAWRGYGPKVARLDVPPFQATVSAGCIELRRAEFSTMVKTRWSETRFFCDDF
jgi:hypothetical protein